MTRIQFHAKAHYYLAILIAICIPVARFTPVFIALMLLNWIVEGDFKNKFLLIFKNKFALLFMSFYIMHLLGMLYSKNIDFGLFDIQVKFSILVFPLILVNRPINSEKIKFVFYSFILGGIISSLILLSHAVYTYFVFGENNFFYQAFSILVHPSYIAMYLDFSIAWILYSFLNKSFNNIRFYKLYTFLLVSFFSFIIVLLSSKMGMITLVLLFIGFLVYYIISRKKYATGIVSMFFLLALIYSVVKFVPFVRDRVQSAVTAMTSTSSNQNEGESTAVRLLIWKAANQVISENFLLGTGTGDSKDALLHEYEKRGMTSALEHKLNTHNEFYQVFVSIGLIGFILFIANLFVPLFFAFKTSNSVYLLFLVILILNIFPESMFETQAGVMFYSFFNSLLCFQYFNNDKSNIKI